MEIDLSDAFDDPDGDALTYEAESSDESVATVEVDGDTLTVRGVGRGTAETTATAEDADGRTAAQTFEVTVTAPDTAWYLPPASDTLRQGFVRVLNHSDIAGEASIAATDDAGVAHEPLTLALGPRAATHFHTGDLESGNTAKGLTGATGPGDGGWRLAIESDTLDVEALAYVRADDGFLTGLNDVAPLEDGALRIATFNPGSNVDQVSHLRLVNPGGEEAEATVTGTDDAGESPGSPVVLTLPAGTACMVDAAQLESGTGLACGSPQDGLGDGAGKWRLAVESDEHLVAMSLLASTGGHLSNLSGKASPDWENLWHVHLFPAASDPLGRQGVVRAVNRAAGRRTATVLAYDDSDTRYDALRLSLGAARTAHFDSDDLELGNRSKGLSGRTGAGTGTWRLTLYGRERGARLRARGGRLPGGHERNRAAGALGAPGGLLQSRHQPPHERAAAGEPLLARGGSVDRRHGRPGAASRHDGAGAGARDGRGGADGRRARVRRARRDRLRRARRRHPQVAAARRVGPPRGRAEPAGKPVGPPDETCRMPTTRAGSGICLRRCCRRLRRWRWSAWRTARSAGRWSAVEGALYDVDLLHDGMRDELRSLERARSTSFRWLSNRPGTYAIRARSANADGVAGPWSAVSDEVVIE